MSKIHMIYIASTLILCGALIAALIVFNNVPYKIAIHFTAEQGIDIFGDRNDVYAIAILGLMLNIINFGLTKVLLTREKFIGWAITITNAFISFLIVLAIVTIIINN